MAIPSDFDNRYEIRTEVGTGGMGVVYSAYDRLTGELVALKNVKADENHISQDIETSLADFRLALAREFSVLATLRHPNIISVLDYGFDLEDNPYFTMTLLDLPRNIVDYARGFPVEKQINLILQMLEAISYLHRRGIIHRDLKPENVIIEKEQVKVLDFGVATPQRDTLMEPTELLVGTLAYMAPEIFEEEYQPNRSADIYAAGLIIYEIFTGIFPYDTSNVAHLIQDATTKIPDLSLIEDIDTRLDVKRLALTVGMMLEKDPSDRYRSVETVITTLYELLGAERRTNVDVRESLLQAAEMVGRDAQLKVLDNSLKQLVDATGSVWLIGGDAGTGKSRLADELRILALVRGILVVRGQTITGASAPYQLWRSVISRLILEVELDLLQASILKPMVDNIELLTGLDHVPDAPDIGAVASYNRLLTVILDLFVNLKQPLLVILEDIHWASESLNLLRQIIPLAEQNQIMIVCTYRREEKPDLPNQLPAQHLMLNTLRQSDIQNYANSIMGQHSDPYAISELLQTETNGNIMHMIEVLRAIIEEFGSLQNFDPKQLPDNMLGNGIKGVIRYRMRNVPQQYREMFEMTAIIGRVINLELMRELFSADAIDDWLIFGEEMMLLRIRNDQWRIANKSIRETLLEDLTTDAIQAMHIKVAEVIESLHGNQRDSATLAYHWYKAGNVQKEAHYKMIAVKKSFESSAFTETVEYLDRLLWLHKQQQVVQKDVTIAQFHRMLGASYLELGQITQALDHLKTAVGTVRTPIPRHKGMQIVYMLGEVIRQVWHRMNLPKPIPATHANYADLVEGTAAMNQIGEVVLAYQPDPIMSVYASLRVLNMSELLGSGFSLLYSYAGVGILTASLGRRSWAETYLKLAHDLLKQDLPDNAIAVSTFPMAIIHTGWGEWEQAQELIEQCLAVSNKIGDWKSWREVSGLAGDVYHYLGEYQKSIQYYEAAYNSTERVGNVSQLAIQLAIRSRTLFVIGQYDEAVQAAKKSLALDSSSPIVTLSAWSVYVLDAIRLKDWQNLEKQLDILDTHIETNPFMIYVHLDGYATSLEGHLALLEEFNNPKILANAKKACEALNKFGATYPIGEPRAKILEARLQSLSEKSDQALNLAQDGLQIAEKLKMPYDIGLAHMVLSELKADDEHLQHARSNFTNINSLWGIHQLG